MSDELINIKKYKAKGISKSEPDITTAEKQRWDSGFPPGVTVDELRWFRKRRPQGCSGQRDHLSLGEGSFKTIESEYTRRYRNHSLMSGSEPNLIQEQETVEPTFAEIIRPPDSLRCEGSREFKPLYAESFREHPLEQTVKRRPRNSFLEIMEACKESDDGNRFSTEIRSKYVEYSDVAKSELLRRPTNLKVEGDLLAKTEQTEKFIEYLLTKREHLLRKPTTLKLEGEMEKKTETSEQYAPVEYQKRPPLCKKSTNLHLEGDFDILTENLEKYVPLEYQPRPALTKASTNLHLEGELDLQPEYRDVYVEYKTERPRPSLPSHNLKLDGFFATEAKSNAAHPPIPFLRGANSGRKIGILGDDLTIKYRPEYREKFIEHSRPERSQIRRPQPHLQQKGDMQTVTENKFQFTEKRSPRTERRRLQNNLKLEGGLDLTPEYRKSYVNYYDEESKSQLKRRGTLMRSTTLRNEGDMEINPEYRSSYVNFPRERPFLRRPECHLINEGEMNHLTEKHAKYVQHSNYPRTEALRREPELKLEGNFECQPEYRKAYIDYLIRERVERKPRPLDNLGAQPRRAFEIVESRGESQVPPAIAANANTENVKVVVEQTPKIKTSAQGTRTSHIPVAVRKQQPPETPASSKRPSSQHTSTTLPKTGLLRVKPETSGSSSSKQSSSNVSPIPSGRRSRSDGPSRKSTKFKDGSKEEVIHHSRVGSRFSSPVKVEDLAYRPCTSPLSVLLQHQPRKSRRDVKTGEKKSRAFLVIDDEVNNNYEYKGKRNSHDGLFKEQRWMSPWYSPPP